MILARPLFVSCANAVRLTGDLTAILAFESVWRQVVSLAYTFSSNPAGRYALKREWPLAQLAIFQAVFAQRASLETLDYAAWAEIGIADMLAVTTRLGVIVADRLRAISA